MSNRIFACDATPDFYNAAYFIGNVINLYLYGTLTVQLYLYHISFPEDPRLFKVVIYIVYAAETVYTTLLTYDMGTILARTTGLGADICVTNSPMAVILAVCGGILTFLAQSMYAYRIQILTKLKFVSWVIITVLAAQFLATVIITILQLESSLLFVALVSTSISLTADVTITSIMVYFLKKDKIYSKQLKWKITRLVYLIVGTGFVAAATNICTLALLFTAPKYALGSCIILCKLYTNSMMILVNSRIHSARAEKNHMKMDMITVQLSSIHATSQANGEHGQREISVDASSPETRDVTLLNAEDTSGEYDLGRPTV